MLELLEWATVAVGLAAVAAFVPIHGRQSAPPLDAARGLWSTTEKIELAGSRQLPRAMRPRALALEAARSRGGKRARGERGLVALRRRLGSR